MTKGYEERQELRKQVEKRLLALEEGERIEIPKELLEKLLFETIKFQTSSSSQEFQNAKFLVWSGEFLKKIDLSEVSFEDVVWGVNEKGDFDALIDEWGCKRYRGEYYKIFGVERIVLSGTNAKIDFKKSFVYKVSSVTEYPTVSISGCDFSGVDLSQNIIEGDIRRCYIENSNFDNTKLKVSSKKNKIGIPSIELTFRNSSFVNCDFSEIECNAYELMPTNMQNYYIPSNGYFGCNLCNTGLRIILPKPDDKCFSLIEKYASILKLYDISNPYSLYQVRGNIKLKYYRDSENNKVIRSMLGLIDQLDWTGRQDIEDILFNSGFGTAFWVLRDILEEDYEKAKEEGREESIDELKYKLERLVAFMQNDRTILSIASYVRALNDGLLYGCYVNGIKILTPQERELKRIELAQKYGRNESNPDLNTVDDAIQAVRKR